MGTGVSAGTVAPANFVINLSSGTQASYNTPGSYSLGSVSAELASDASYAHAHATSVENGPSVSAGVDAYYYFGVSGGNYGDHVPVLIYGSLHTATTAADDRAPANASAGLSVTTRQGSDSVNVVCGNVARGGDCSNHDWSGALHAIAWVGFDDNVIHLSVGASSCCAGATTDAYADPYIMVDPSFAGAAQYSVVVSDGVSNSPAQTPEPFSAVLGGTGFAGLALLRRFRKSVR